jgi:hypothetical protein
LYLFVSSFRINFCYKDWVPRQLLRSASPTVVNASFPLKRSFLFSLMCNILKRWNGTSFWNEGKHPLYESILYCSLSFICSLFSQ